MIVKESLVQCIDNTGAKFVKCIKVLGNYSFGFPGCVLVVTIKHAVPRKTIKKKKFPKKGEIYKVLLVRTKYGLFRKVGQYIVAKDNAIVLLRKESRFMPLGNRIKGPVLREIRRRHSKVLALATDVL